MLSLLLAAAAFAPQGPSLAPVVINEFSYDDAGTDDKEFIELFNRTNAAIDISGWIVQGEEGTATSGANLSFTLPAGTIIAAGGYVVVGTALVPNLTPGCTVAVNFLENSIGGDGITLRDPTLTVIDSVVWCYAVWTAPVPTWLEGSGLWGRILTNDVAAVPNFTSAQRRVNGYDSDDNGADFVYMTWTPGTANGSANPLPAPLAGAYVNLCDGAALSNLATDFAASFRTPTLYDPAAITNATASTIAVPPSPQGGNIAVINDPTGGGDAAMLRVPVGEDFVVECWVYVTGGNALLAGTEGESWGIGVGTTDSYAAPVDVPGTYYASASACPGTTGTAPLLSATGSQQPGATGIAWFAYTTTSQTVLYLVDMNNGGPGFTVLGGPIVATPGVNDGWQRLRIRASGTSVIGNFGGTFASDDGTRFTATVAARVPGQVYFQYRECALANANMRPLMIDRLEVYGTIPFGVSSIGTASPTTLGTPNLATSGGSPVIGNAAFTFQVSGHVPSGIGALLLGLGALGPGSPVPGAPPTVQVYVAPIATVLLFSDGLGNTSYGFPLPADNAMAGLPITGQTIDLDANLLFAVPIGSSQGLQVTIGN